VIHGVAAAVERNFLGIDPEGLFHRHNRGAVSRGANDARIETRHIILENRGRVALGIDRDEQRANILRVWTELAENLRNLEQRGRAHVGAVGKAKEHQVRMAYQVLLGDRLRILVDQLERPADRR